MVGHGRRISIATALGIFPTFAFVGRAQGSYPLGDTLPGPEAGLSRPNRIFVDEHSALLIADTGNNRIRLVEGTPPTPVIQPDQADFDGDGTVGFGDFLLFAPAFGGFEQRFDIDGSGAVDFADFLAFASVFGQAT